MPIYRLLLALAILPSAAKANPHITPAIDITIYDPESNQLLYKGQETVTVSNNDVTKISKYQTPDGKPVQEEKAGYDMRALQIQEFSLTNFVTGETSRVERDGNTYKISHQPTSKESPSTTTLDVKPRRFIGKVLHHIIIDRWKKIEGGEPYTFELIIPSRLETITFQILLHQQNAEQVVFRMQPDSWLIRKFVDPLDFYYDRSTQHLVRYTGPSLISHEQDNVVRADFRHQEKKKP